MQAQSIDGSDTTGTVVALNDDGNRLVMGGFATLFVYDGSTNNDGTVEWSLSADLSDSFSSWISAVDITSDGGHIIVSETTEDVTSPDFDAATEYTVRAFKYVGSWVQDGSDLVSENPGDGFGASIAISEDGSKIVVGAPYGNYVDIIFAVIGQEWTLRLDGVEDNSFFGSTVSLAADGRFLAVGAPHGKDYQGCAYVIDTNQKLVVHSFFGSSQGEINGDYFGSTLAFSKDQSVLAVGSTAKSDANTYASVFLLNSDTDQYDPISSIQGTGERSRGWSLALSADGGRMTVGMPYNDEEGTNSGKTSIYAIANESLFNVGTFLGAPEDKMGSTVSISGDGTVIASGAIGNENISARLMKAIPA